MVICRNCGREVAKCTVKGVFDAGLCFECVKQAEPRPVDEDLAVEEHEQRTSVRIPVAINLNVMLEEDGVAHKMRYPAFSVDISVSGMCFAWEPCGTCTEPPTGKGVHESCIFYPYCLENEHRQALIIGFQLRNEYSVRLEAHPAYVMREEELGLEYIGAKFANVSNQDRRVLEKIMISLKS